MSSLAHNCILGIDVSKDFLDIFDGTNSVQIDNTNQSIKQFFKALDFDKTLSIEPTGKYHQKIVYFAISAGLAVYLVDPYRVSRYREAIGSRVKTDYQDARLLHRYLVAEIDNLVPYKPAPGSVQLLNELLRVRGKLSKEKSSIRLSLASVKSLTKVSKSILSTIEKAIVTIDKQLEECIEKAGYDKDHKRCMDVPGIGPVVSTGMIAMFHRGKFRSSDAFIAFIGMDVRVRESGRYRGQRKLTKKGNPEIRRLLFNAARAGSRTKYWNGYYNSLRDRGLKSTQATIAVARKIARVAFALLRDKKEFIPQRG